MRTEIGAAYLRTVSDAFDPLDLQAQEADRERREAKDELNSQNEIEDWAWLMAEKRGRRIVWRLLERTGMYRSSFTGDSATFFNEGQRNVGLLVMSRLMAAAPESFALMTAENGK